MTLYPSMEFQLKQGINIEGFIKSTGLRFVPIKPQGLALPVQMITNIRKKLRSNVRPLHATHNSKRILKAFRIYEPFVNITMRMFVNWSYNSCKYVISSRVNFVSILMKTYPMLSIKISDSLCVCVWKKSHLNP